MKNKIGKVFVSVALVLLFMSVFISVVNAQTPVPPTRDSLTKEIQARAQSDVAYGKPMESTEGLNALFGKQAEQVGMPLSEVLSIYEQEYKVAKAAKSWWEGWLPNLGWVAAFIALLAAIFRGAIEEAGKKFVTSIGGAIYYRVARYRPFWMFALRKYRQSLEKTYSELKIPFRQGRPLQMQDVYVPVRVDGGNKKRVDAYQTIQQHKRLVVLGDPGSGKTMLLRHVAFMYAWQGLDDFQDSPIPVFLELNRVESAGNSLLEALTKALENHNFPGAGGFLQSALENKSLLILLDGLDEVNMGARPALVSQIKDLDQKYPDNRIIVTCRKAVYQGELDAWVDQKLEIVEFSDQQIQRFMTSWQKDMPAEKSIEHFFRTLQERPQIMALARNPLLLTMVAYLYTDTEFALPHSRSDFYKYSTDLLLEQWHIERNHYKATHKRIVLQRLALFNQSQAGRTGERRTLELADALREIRAVLPDLTLKTEDAQPLLDEIVQRSGLMLAIDGGTRCQFTHLTLQEYFAARALEADQKGLLDFYRAAPDAWREVVRIWCALEHDSTAMLKELEAIDPVMAFECLSDAQQVDNAYADELMENFKPRLRESLENDSLASAFALLAVDPRPRGRKWFEFVTSNLNDEENRLATCTVLARTNIPQAAEPLAKLATNSPDVIPFLVQLGNLAVPALTEPVQKGEIGAMDALVDIGTPQAAFELQPLLWSDEPKAYHAAWRLAALLPLSGVEEILQTVKLHNEQRKTKQLEWVWEPFSDNVTLRAITGRIAYLLHTTLEGTLPKKELPCDSRLAIPLCSIAAQNVQIKKIEDEKRKQMRQEIYGHDFISAHIREISEHPNWLRLFNSLPDTLQSSLFPRLIQEQPIPSSDDWHDLFKPVSYYFSDSWHAKVLKFLLVILIPLNLWGAWLKIRQSPTLLTWGNAGSFLFCILLLVGMIWILKIDWELNGLGFSLLLTFLGLGGALGNIIGGLLHSWIIGAASGFIIGFGSSIIIDRVLGAVESDFKFGCGVIGGMVGVGGGVIGSSGGNVAVVVPIVVAIVVAVVAAVAVYDSNRGGRSDDIISIVVNSLVIVVVIIVDVVVIEFLAYFASNSLYDWAGLLAVFIFWSAWLGAFMRLYFMAMRQERRAQNPLHGLLEPLGAAFAPRQTSRARWWGRLFGFR